jgi:hypothetical protein
VSLVFPLTFKLELLAIVFVHQGFPSLFVWVVAVVAALTDQFAEERLARSLKLKQTALVLFGSAMFLSVCYYLAALLILTEEGGALKLKYAGLFLGMLFILRVFAFLLHCLFSSRRRIAGVKGEQRWEDRSGT